MHRSKENEQKDFSSLGCIDDNVDDGHMHDGEKKLCAYWIIDVITLI